MEIQLNLDRSRRLPLSTQIAHAIRDAIFAQQLAPGTRLPPTRELAKRLQVARMVVVEAYDWLAADGYIDTRRGSGTFITQRLSGHAGQSRPPGEPPRRTDLLPDSPAQVDFRPGLPALDLFPRKVWNKTISRALEQAETAQLGYGPVEGLPRLRRLIAAYAARARGLPLRPDQVIITVGAAQAFDLLLRSLAPVGRVVVENPGSEPVGRLLQLEHVQAVPVAVDRSGLCVDQIPAGPEAPRLAYVMPSHQYPTGWTMSLDRRMELLAWAETNQAVILEDDYDSEFRYDRQPPIALAALDSLQRVAYVGTFSKTMFPGLRLGYCILPEQLIPRVLDLKWFSDRCVPVIEQLALAEWLESGMLERHIRKMRAIYAKRREVLTASLLERFGEDIQVLGVNAGMHILISVHLGLEETELVERAMRAGIRVYPACPSYIDTQPSPAEIILGFGQLTEAAIQTGIELLAHAWKRK
jgi:GntR family transcriptional regulator/MocR family aminotransferase